MLYIRTLVLSLLLSAHAAMAAVDVRFDASVDADLPDNAETIKHGGLASVEIVDKKLVFTPGSVTNSALAGVVFHSERSSLSTDSRSVTIDFEPFAGRIDESRAKVSLGFVAAPEEAKGYFFLGERWSGITAELGEANDDGSYTIRLRQRWETGVSGEAHLTPGVTADAALVDLCKLSNCPTEIGMRIEEGKVTIHVEGAAITSVSPSAQLAESGEGVVVALEPQMAAILSTDLNPVVTFANHGELFETPVLSVNSISVGN